MATFDIEAPDFVETFVTALREDSRLPGFCYLEVDGAGDDELPYRFTLREWAYTDEPIMCASNFEAADERLALCAGYDAATQTITATGGDGLASPALKELAKILNDLDGYPLLDEDDYSQRQFEYACENGLDLYGDEIFEEWRAGDLTSPSDCCSGDFVPPPDAQPDAESYADLTGDVGDFIREHAIMRCLEGDCCW